MVVALESSPYEGGSFLTRLVFSDDYPDAPPKGQFVTTIYHPNVSPSNGDICVSTLQKDWRPDLGIAHLLLVASRPAPSDLTQHVVRRPV